jgi:uncharacterized membrane protein YkvA (DUF1232 family)
MTAWTVEDMPEPTTPADAWRTLRSMIGRLGSAVMEKALIVYYMAIDPRVDPRYRATLLAALAYLGMPLDAVPDVLPVVGFSDDAAVLVAAIACVAAAVRPRHIKEARARMKAWGLNAAEEDHGEV